MDYQVTEAPSAQLVKFIITEAENKALVDKKLKEVTKKAVLPGFRPGHVPPNVVRNRHGGELQMEEILNVTYKALAKHVEQEELDVFCRPYPVETNLNRKKMVDGEIVVEYLVPYVPKFELKMDGTNPISEFALQVSDQDLERKLFEHSLDYSTDTLAITSADDISEYKNYRFKLSVGVKANQKFLEEFLNVTDEETIQKRLNEHIGLLSFVGRTWSLEPAKIEGLKALKALNDAEGVDPSQNKVAGSYGFDLSTLLTNVKVADIHKLLSNYIEAVGGVENMWFGVSEILEVRPIEDETEVIKKWLGTSNVPDDMLELKRKYRESLMQFYSSQAYQISKDQFHEVLLAAHPFELNQSAVEMLFKEYAQHNHKNGFSSYNEYNRVYQDFYNSLKADLIRAKILATYPEATVSDDMIFDQLVNENVYRLKLHFGLVSEDDQEGPKNILPLADLDDDDATDSNEVPQVEGENDSDSDVYVETFGANSSEPSGNPQAEMLQAFPPEQLEMIARTAVARLIKERKNEYEQRVEQVRSEAYSQFLRRNFFDVQRVQMSIDEIDRRIANH